MSLLNITLDKTSHFKSEKLKFYNWVSKWACSNIQSEEIGIDIAQICAVLQTMGFKLQLLDTQVDMNHIDDQQNNININITCKKSGLRALLFRPHLECLCPNTDKVSDGKSILPSTSDATSQVVKEIMIKLFSILNDTKDINQNNNDDNLQQENLNSKPTLTRQPSWEVDPKTSPPLGTSSPLPEENSDQEVALVDLLQEGRNAIDKALVVLLSKNNTFTKSKYVKRVSNIKVSPRIATCSRSTTAVSSPNVPLKKSPILPVILHQETPKKNSPVLSERRQLLMPSKVKFLARKDTLTPTNESCKSNNKKGTPWSTGKSPAFMSPKATKTSSLRGNNSNFATGGMSSNSVKPKSGIPSFGFKPSTPKKTVPTSLKKV